MQVLRSSMPWSVLNIVLLTGVSPLLAREHMAASSASDHVVAAVDVVLTHRVIEADGTPAIPISTESAFTLQKLRTGSGATKIRLTYRPARPGVSASAPRTPLVGARVEYDPASQSTTVFDEDGQRPNPRLSLTRSSAALGSFDSWLESLVIAPADVSAREQALERSHGRPVGRVGRLSRYVQVRGEFSEELLVDPESALPVEVNVVRQNVLETHTTIEYGTTARGQLVRQRLRSEQLIDASSGRRSVVDVDFSNVAAEGW